jgi:predicted DNA-binding protein with PD1-like motif
MDWKNIDAIHLIRLYPGEELVAELTQWSRMQELLGGTVEGLGGIRDVELGYFDLDRQEYHRWNNPGNWELVHLWGNLTFRDGNRFWHLHATISDREGRCMGGHLFSAQVAVTAELVIRPWEETVHRSQDEITGLDLWELGK